MADTLTNRVRRGARLLDARYGRGWRRRVKLRQLDIADGCNCVLGQLHGGYHRGSIDLGLDAEAQGRLGFDASRAEAAAGRYREVTARLTELWADEIRTSRKART